LLIGGSLTDNALSEVFGWTQKRIDTIPAPAAGQWYNSELPPVPLDPEGALDLLASVGIVNTTGHWENTNAAIGPVGELRDMYVLGCPEAIESTTAMTMRYFAAWNAFFGLKSDDVSNYFTFDLIAWVSMGDIVWMERSFDIEGAGWNVGRDPDYLFDFFHSSKDGVDDYNLPGIHNAELDALLYEIKYWRFTNDTYITDIQDMIDIAWEAEEYLYYLTPYMVKYCAVATNAFSPGLKSWIESLGYGSDNGDTYNWIYWTDLSLDTIDQANTGPIGSLNPGIASTVYEWAVMNRIYDGLFSIDSFLHNDVMWGMTGYEITPWIEEGVVEFGQKVTVHLRHGIYWHDGDPYTTADLKFNYDFIQNAEFGRYSDVLLTYHNTTIIDDYTCEIYIKCTGIWTVYAYFGSAMIFPENVWGVFWDDPAAAAAFTPWTENYDTYTGSTGHGALTCLIGTGPWIFTDWNQVAGVVPLIANRPDAVWAGNPGYWAYWFLRDDMNFDGIVNLFDAVKLAGAAGAEPGNPRWNYGQADITADYIVDLFDAVRLSSHAGWITLPH
jgi:ABC-type transport system substrate-binding protein